MSDATQAKLPVSARIAALVRRLPCGDFFLRRLQMREFARTTTGMTRQQIFTAYYERHWWTGARESRSGAGSTVSYTTGIRSEIPKLLTDLGIKSILDAPCGDYNWFRHVELPSGMDYVGADIVQELIAANRLQHQRPGVTFRELDIVKDPLPTTDVWLCRAALNHFSDQDIWATLRNFLGSNIRYLLTTSFPESSDNRDIVTGFYRALNLERPPFSLPKPLRCLDDGVHVGQVLKLCLWERSALSQALAANPHSRKFAGGQASGDTARKT